MSQSTSGLDGINQWMDGDNTPFNTGNLFNLSGYTAYYTPKSKIHGSLSSDHSKSEITARLVRQSASPMSPTSASMDEVSASLLQSPAAILQSPSPGESLANMAGLSELVYGNGGLKTSAPLPGMHQIITVNNVQYEVVDEEADSSGYEGMTLWDSASKSIIVVNRGTETANDLWTDTKMAFAATSNQWQGAQALGSRVAALATQYGATSVYCTGHSLGGTLTQMQAAYFGWTGYTFNAYGAGEIYNQLGLAISTSTQVYNYRTLFDLVSDASTQIGYTPVNVETPQDAAMLQEFYSPTDLKVQDLLFAMGQDHSISNFILNDVPNTAVYQSANIPINLVPGFTASIPPQTLSLAQDVVASLGEIVQAALGGIPSGDLSLQQYVQEVMQFMNNEPASGIKAFIPWDSSLLSNALNSSTSNNNYRASLSVLSPVLLEGDAAAFTSSAYNLWAPGQTSGLTVDYLTARNAMIQAMIASAALGQQIGGAISTSNENSYVYTDLNLSPSPRYTINGRGGSTYDIVFADNKGDVLTGSSSADVELFGGTGNDTLYGGATDSTLQGGAGNDEYVINGSGAGTDYILDTDGQGSIVWKLADGTSETLTGGDDQSGTPYWKSSDGKITYAEDLSADGSTELEILSASKIVYIDDFTNGEFGINLNTGPSGPTGASNLSQLKDEGLIGDTTAGGGAQEVYEDDIAGALVGTIYGANTSGSSFGNQIQGDGNATFISAGNGNNTVLLGNFYHHATDPLATPISATVQGGSGNQDLVGVGNGEETIIGGTAGTDTSAATFIDGGGANGDLIGGGQNSVIFGGTGADTLEASAAVGTSSSGFNPTSILIAGLSFWGDAYSTKTDSNGKNYDTTALPNVSWSGSSPDNIQVDLSVYQSDGTYAAPFNLLGSSLDSGATGAATLPGSLLIGGTGQDVLIGNSGNDTLIGGQPINPVAGKVDEVLIGGAGANVIYGGGGTEIIYADMSPGAVSGWAGLDSIDADTIYGGSGNEFIYGSGGNDQIYGGSGKDVIYTGNGAAYVDSGSGTSSIYGGTGNDTIIVDGVSDYVKTGDGNTYVKLITGNSSVIGGSGQDTVELDGGGGFITGGAGLATIIAGSSTGADTIQSGSGGTVIQLTDGLTESTIVARNVNGDLVLTDAGFETQLTISGYFGAASGVSLQFADGSIWGTSQILSAAMTANAYGASDTLVGSNGNDSITAGYGDTSIVGVSGNNTLTGGAGNDTIDGGSGADTIEGGSGTTQIIGGTGRETYVYNLSDGSDTIVENTSTTGNDTLSFGHGISASDLSYTYDASTDTLQLQVASSGATITVTNFVATQANQHQLSALTFADGTTLSQLQVIQKAVAIIGTTGNDDIVGTSTMDYFDGKGGNDTEQGNGGNDTFVFDAGYGHLEINESYTSGQQPVVQLGAGIAASSLHVTSDGTNLLLTDGVSGDQITIDNMWSTLGDGITAVQLADGTTLTAAQLIQMGTTGTTGNDTLYGTPGGEVFDGKGGNDVERGNGGSDTFVFNAGYGQLEINESFTSGQVPVLRLGTGITLSTLHATTDGTNLFLTDGVSGDQITLDGMWSNSNDGVMAVQLADGTTLTQAQLIQLEMTGTTGADTIYGTSGADLIDGKGGSDFEQGNGGSDTFVFNAGYGQLEIDESYTDGQAPVLQLGTGITAASLHVAPTGYDLNLTDGVSGDQITLDGMWNISADGVAVVKLADGTTLTRAQLIQMGLTGTTGNDTLYGTTGADLIDGKGGNDVEQGNGGSDTFVFNAGYGHLEINESYTSGQQPLLQLGAGITASALRVTLIGSNLVLTDGISGDAITLDRMFYSDTSGVSAVQLADGTILTRAQLIQMEMTGTTGNDSLYGTAGADLIDGKGGNDFEQGNGGSDTFVFNAGYGDLEIYESYTSNQSPVLQLGAGITVSNLSVSTDETNLYLTDGISGDQIKLDSMWSDSTHGVAQVRLADGTTLTPNQLMQMEMTGTTGNDTLYGTSGADVLDGKGGNDFVRGEGGSDTFVFNAGYGQLTISESYASGEVPVLQLGAGISASSLKVTASPSNQNVQNLVLTDGISGDQITLDFVYNLSGNASATYGVQEVRFADGTTLTRDQLFQMASQMTSTTGNDTLIGTPGAELFDGKGGNDYVVGDGGSDTFVFNAGYGQLDINEFVTGSQDQSVLQLGPGILPSSFGAQFSNSGALQLNDDIGDVIYLEHMDGLEQGGVQEVRFADGETLTRSMVLQMVYNGLMASQVLPAPSVDSITGTTGNDTLQGTAVAEYFDGKGGNDVEQGGGGSDTFVFNAGYGHLEINEQYASGSCAVLQLGSGISSFTVTTDGTSLYLTDGISGDQIIMDGAYSSANPSNTFEVRDADGGIWTANALDQRAVRVINGTTGNDTLVGTPGMDLIDGKGGNDLIEGGGGNDTFVFNAGYGHLEINESYTSSQSPTLQLGTGITTANFSVMSDGTNLYLTDGTSGDQITLDSAASQSGSEGVWNVTFTDGTLLYATDLIQMAGKFINGTTGSDTLTGTANADLIDGKGGTDSVTGGGGNDTFVFNSGYGQLTINEVYKSGQTPVLKLGTGIAASALHATKSGNNLVLTDGVSGDQITLINMWSTSTDGVASLQLSNGTTLTRSQIIALEMTGTTGNDTITGTSGADLIDGKGGIDSVTGGGGNDTFVFNSGYGQLTINEAYTSGQTPVLKLGAGITASALHATKSGNNLVLTDGVSGDQITLVNMWSVSTDGVATLQLSDGSTLTRSQIIALEMTGTTGNDTITGTSGADLIDGKGGTDSVTGGGGNDTFVFNSGYGKLTINEVYTSGQAPVLKLGAGITASTLHVAQSSNNMVLTDGVSGDQITLIGMWTTSTDGVATVQFSDGSTLTRSQLLTKGAVVKSSQLSGSANSITAAPTEAMATSSIPSSSATESGERRAMDLAAVRERATPHSSMSGDATNHQVNAMIHAIASFTGTSSGDAGHFGHPMSPAIMPDLMLHSAA